MTSFAELCKRLQREIKEVKNNTKSIKIDPYRVGLEASRGERLARAKDEVAFLKKPIIGIKNNYKVFLSDIKDIKDRIADLEAGIKILEGKA